MSGTSPHLISMIDIRASGVRKRMSAPSASWKPPPKRHALDRGDHRHRKLPPAPHRLLRKIGQPMGARGKVALLATGDPVTAALLHRGEASHIETGAERPPLAGQYYRPHAFFMGKPLGRGDQRLEHRGIERVHLVRPHQSDVGDAVRNR